MEKTNETAPIKGLLTYTTMIIYIFNLIIKKQMKNDIILFSIFLLSLIQYSYSQDKSQTNMDDSILNQTPKQIALKWIEA